jgi:hypothetical protein
VLLGVAPSGDVRAIAAMPDPSGDTSDQPTRPPTALTAWERRYTEEDLALILNRAAELQEGVQSSAPRYSLADIQEIAAGAGIAPTHVASVAATLGDARTQRRGGVWGAPDRTRVEESIDGEVADEVIAELFDLARRELGLQGVVSEALGTLEWKGQSSLGWNYVTVARRVGRTTIAVMTTRTDALAATASVGGVGAVFGGIGLGAALVAGASVAGPIALLAGFAAATGGAWLGVRATWRRIARRSAERTSALLSALVASARRAVDEGRVLQR